MRGECVECVRGECEGRVCGECEVCEGSVWSV